MGRGKLSLESVLWQFPKTFGTLCKVEKGRRIVTTVSSFLSLDAVIHVDSRFALCSRPA